MLFVAAARIQAGSAGQKGASLEGTEAMASDSQHYSSDLTGNEPTPQDASKMHPWEANSIVASHGTSSLLDKRKKHRGSSSRAIENTWPQPGLNCLSSAEGLVIADKIEAFDHALSVEELAPLLGLSESNLYSKAREGRIPSYRIFGSIRFDPKKTAEWLRLQYIAVA